MISHARSSIGMVTSIFAKTVISAGRSGIVLLAILAFSSPTFSQVLINEVITDPQIDWSTNSFDGTDGFGPIDSNDEWIELYVSASGLDLTGWTIELNDGTNTSGTITAGGAFVIMNYISGTGGTFIDTDAGDYIVLGQPNGSSTDAAVTVILRDNTTAIIDQVEVAAGSGTFFTGASTGITDESVCRIPNGTDTDVDAADFVLSQATLGTDNSPTGTVLINEVITDPQQDWSTSGFDGTIGGGAIDSDDDWVELYIGTSGLNLTKWIIELNDGTDELGSLASGGAFQVTNYVSQTGGSFTDTDAGDYLVLGTMTTGAINQSVTIVVRDAYSNIVDQVEIASGSGTMFTGNATDADDESVCRIPNGQDTDIEVDDFVKTRATLAANNSPQGIVLINELVVQPQQDWSASGFTDPAPGGSIGSTDEWIELYIGTSGLNLTKWTIEVTDAGFFSGDLTSSGAFEVVNYLGSGAFNNTVAGDYLILGNPTGSETITNDAYFELIHPDGTTIDDVEIGDDIEGDGVGDGAADGSASGGLSTSIADEAIFRVPLGADTDDDVADFRKGLASLGAENGIIYVDASAPDDTGFGRMGDPKQLIQSGLNIAVEDGRVMVAAGTYNENITISNPVTLEGANVGIDGNGTRGAESIIEPLTQSDVLEIDADSVTIDGFQIGVALADAAIYATDNSYLNIQYNVINADSVGIAFVTGTAGTYNITSNLITTADFTTADANLTAAVTLSGLTGDADVNLTDNEYAGSGLGVFVFDCMSNNVLSITNDTTANSIRGISVFSFNGLSRASSTIAVDGFSATNFAEPPGGITNFPETGIYFFTDGSSTNSHLITATVNNSSFSDVENTTSDYAGIICGDFSSSDYTEYLQDITITECTFSNNENRGVYVRGQNARAGIARSTFTNNGHDPTGAGGNFGWVLAVRGDAEVSVVNSFFTSPATQTTPGTAFEYRGIHVQTGSSLSITNSNFDNNGNPRGLYASSAGIDFSGNYFGTTVAADIDTLVQSNDFTPYLESGTDSDPGTAGFQGDFDALTVTPTGTQTSGDRLQEGHDLLNTNGTLTVLQDDYLETLTVSKNIVIDPEAATTIDDVTLNGGGLRVLADLEINNTLTLTSGILDIDLDDGDKSDDPTLTLNNAVGGSFDFNSHVEGKMEVAIGAAGTFSFPAGDEGAYRPVDLTPTNASTFSVSHIAEAAPIGGGANGDMRNLHGTASSQLTGNIESTLTFRYWGIDVISGTPGSTNVTIQINSGDNASDPTTLGMLRFDGTNWLEMTRIGAAGTDPYTITGQTTSFSEFSIYSTDMDTNPLPVELLDFTGRSDNRDVRLSWITLTETNSDYFQVERSTNGEEFIMLGSVTSHGTSSQRHNYSYVDMNVQSTIYYYRLKMVDFDGSYEYSPTILVTPNLSNIHISVYPNPASDFLQIEGIETGYLKQLTFYDLNGKLRKVISSFETQVQVSDLSQGNYLMRLELVDGSVFEGKLVKD